MQYSNNDEIYVQTPILQIFLKSIIFLDSTIVLLRLVGIILTLRWTGDYMGTPDRYFSLLTERRDRTELWRGKTKLLSKPTCPPQLV